MDDGTLQLRVQPYMQPGEKILWTGRPDPSRLFSRGDAFLIPFSLMWGGFAVFWEVEAMGAGAPAFFMLWGIPFVVVGQYFIWGRFIYKRWDRRRTVYAVTNQRVVILRGTSVQSLFLNQLPAVNESTHADGSGSLEFGSSRGDLRSGFSANTGMDLFGTRRSVPAFYDIPDVSNVYRLVDQARSGLV